MEKLGSSGQIRHATENFSTRSLNQKLIVNSIYSMAMIVNCASIYCRVAAAKAYESNWRLVMVMGAYFLFLVLKLIRVTQKSWLVKACKGQASAQEHSNLLAFMDILTLVLFLVKLIFFRRRIYEHI